MKEYNDQEFLYRQTPVDYDGIAKFTSIKGNTLGWNQLVQNGNFASTSGWKTANTNLGTISVSNNVLTYTVASQNDVPYNYRVQQQTDNNLSIPIGHKVYIAIDFNPSQANNGTVCLQTGVGALDGAVLNFSGAEVNKWTHLSTIYTIQNASQYIALWLRLNNPQTVGATFQFRNFMIIDLTAMFGVGNEPATVEEFTSLFSLPYYDYNTGSLLSFNGTGLKSASEDESKEDTLALPVATYFTTGMKSAREAYDELTPDKAITRVGMVDLGTLTYTKGGADSKCFATNELQNLIKPASWSGSKVNAISILYTSDEGNKVYRQVEDKTMGTDGSGLMYFYDSAYESSTVEQFKSAMNGIMLYYELATETETEIDAEIFYPFYGDGTEQILPVNGSTPTTAPIWCDIEYYNQIESETPYRKFWLVNGNGERWDLTEKELKSFLENPQGLGFQKSIDVTRYGERAYKNSESYNFPQVTGDVLFYDSANSTRYEKYNEFVRFLMEQPITLHYMIPVSYNSLIADTYSLECEVMSLTKTESKTDRILTSNIQMNGLGFYEGDEIEINGTANTLTINNKGDFPVGFEIELNGDFKNPYFTLEQNGELYGEAKFDDNANNFSSVFVNSKDGEQNVVLKQSNSIMPNPLAYQDLSISNGSIYVTFVKLAKGESTLTIGGDSYTISGYTIRYTPIYRSV